MSLLGNVGVVLRRAVHAMMVIGCVVAVAPSIAHASPRRTPRGTVQAYLDAIAQGDRRAICGLLSASLRREVVHEDSARSCPAAVGDTPRELGLVPIVTVEVEGNRATVVVGDAQYSDSGNDNVTLRRVHDRWYLTSM